MVEQNGRGSAMAALYGEEYGGVSRDISKTAGKTRRGAPTDDGYDCRALHSEIRQAGTSQRGSRQPGVEGRGTATGARPIIQAKTR